MRLTTLRQEEWEKVAPYIDTLCLPVYRITFSEKQIQLEERRIVEEVAERVEKALAGRLLLLPAITYEGGDDREVFRNYMNSVLSELLRSSFHHLVVVLPEDLAEAAEDRERVMYHPLPVRDDATEEEIDGWSGALWKRIIGLWQGMRDDIVSDEEV